MIRSENNQSVLPQITRYWDQRAQGYALQVDDEFKESLQDVYLPWFESVVPEGSVLDVGCGPGFFSVLLAKAGFAVTAFDASAEMLKKARERANVMGRTLMRYSATRRFFPLPITRLIVSARAISSGISRCLKRHTESGCAC